MKQTTKIKSAKKPAVKKHRVNKKPVSKVVGITGNVLPTTFSFEYALCQMRIGAKMARKGWNGKGMFVVYTPGSKVNLTAGSAYAKLFPKRKTMDIDGHFDMFTAQRTMQPGWLASQADMASDDWVVVK